LGGFYVLMRLRTHVAFSMGLIALLEVLLSVVNPVLVIGSSFVLSYLVNLIIDALGHEERAGRPVRSPRTHTVGRSFTIGLVLGLAVALFLHYMAPVNLMQATVVTLMGPMVGWSHILLDSLTEGGVFVKRKGRWVRFALTHWSYRNPAANWLFTMLGLAMLAYSIALMLHVVPP